MAWTQARLFLVLLISVAGTLAVAPSLFKIRNIVETQRRQRILESIRRQWNSAKPDDKFVAPKEIFVTQPLDHFDPSEEGTYQQRVYINEQFWKNNGPVFLSIGGEGSISQYDVMAGEQVDLARKYGALLFAVEHRYYGASINTDSLELKNMRFLSSQQALADLASFYDYAVKEYDLTSSNTWICFGGSYPGALSAWFRIKYPHIVFGAIASSAPVEAEVNFEGYNEVVAASLSDPVVNGSQKCYSNIKAAFATVDSYIENKMFQKLQTDFNSCNDISAPYDTETFVGNLAGNIMGIVQYNGLMFANITTVCSYMTNPNRTPYSNLVAFNQKMGSIMGVPCVDNSWSNYLNSLSNTTVEKGSFGVGLRQWVYQTCAQFGYYQTCDRNTTCPFSQYMRLGSNLKICAEIFEISSSEVDKRVEFTNDFYGSNHPKGSRIVFVNGSIDPWHALSVLRNQTGEEIAIFINGTSHCQNMEPDLPGDSAALRAARAEIDSIIGGWLEEARQNGKLASI